jgi:hypothetical protein
MGKQGKPLCECGNPALAFPPKGKKVSRRARAKQPYRIRNHWLCQRCQRQLTDSMKGADVMTRYDGGAALEVEEQPPEQPAGPTREQLHAELITASRLGAGRATEWGLSMIDRLLAQCERADTLERMVRSLSDRVKEQSELLSRQAERLPAN